MSKGNIIMPTAGNAKFGNRALRQTDNKIEIADEVMTLEDVAKSGIALTRSNVAVTWIEVKGRGGIILDEKSRIAEETKLNMICQVLAVGPEVVANKVVKPGDYVLMGGAGRLLTVNDKTCGIVKEHMIDAVFPTLPKIGKDDGDSFPGIETKLTERELKKFSEKNKYKG